jgi:hypothetical protein
LTGDDSTNETVKERGAAPETKAPERPVFAHPQWMVGVVLIFGVVAILAGLNDPIWFVIGFPAILVLAVWLWVRWRTRE